MSTFQYMTSGSGFESATPQTPLDRCDLITFLGVAQSRGIDVLPIIWDPKLDNLGQGGTSVIRETSFNPQTKFAFKCQRFRNAYDQAELETRILPSLAAEIAALGHPSLWDCHSVTKLEGICFEIYPPDGQVLSRTQTVETGKGGILPVLVFEKAKHGDLHHFMTHGPGEKLSLDDRLRLCTEIAGSIAIMHINKIVHGDIKPQNILVFDHDVNDYSVKPKTLEIGTRYADSTDVLEIPESEPWYAPDDIDIRSMKCPALNHEPSQYSVKVTDFGYSTQYAGIDDLIFIPKSEPWYAPEWHHRGFTPAQAMRMDSYSFGLVVLWLLCYSTEGDSVRRLRIDLGPDPDNALSLAYRRIEHVGSAQRSTLRRFFEISLTSIASDRCADFLHLRDLLGSELNIIDIHAVQFSGQTDWWAGNFQIIPSIYQLYLVDYRVRLYIANGFLDRASQLEERSKIDSESQELLIQAALCYHIGFGVTKYPAKSQQLLQRCSSSVQPFFMDWLDELQQNDNYRGFRETLFGKTDRRRYLQRADIAQSYIGQFSLRTIVEEYRNEISDIASSLGKSHGLVTLLQSQVSRIFICYGSWTKAEKLETRILETKRKELGELHPGTLASMATLATIHQGLERWKEAEELQLRVMNLRQKKLGPEHPENLNTMAELVVSYNQQARGSEAEQLALEVLKLRTKTLGPEHPAVTESQNMLALIYSEQQNKGRVGEKTPD